MIESLFISGDFLFNDLEIQSNLFLLECMYLSLFFLNFKIGLFFYYFKID